MRYLAVILVLAFFAVGLPGCETTSLRSKPSTEAPAVAAARAAIDEANATLTAINTVIGQNVDAKVWTKEQAQGYLSTSREYRLRVAEARRLLESDPLKAEGQANLLRTLIVALHREVAAQARKP